MNIIKGFILQEIVVAKTAEKSTGPNKDSRKVDSFLGRSNFSVSGSFSPNFE